MGLVSSLLETIELAPPLLTRDAERAAGSLVELVGMDVYAGSIAACDRAIYFLARRGIEKFLCLAWNRDLTPQAETRFVGVDRAGVIDGIFVNMRICDTDHENALSLRKDLPFTAPEAIGVKKSAGLGDRLGLATPGHVRAIRGLPIKPFFAQQSIREMIRTHRTPEEVMDCATWGVSQEGYRDGFGADADHLKTTEDVDRTVAAGFTMYTIDPGDHVDNAADTDDQSALARKFEALPWEELETTAADCRKAYAGTGPRIGPDFDLAVSEEDLLRAAVKYGRAIAHTVMLYRHLVEKMSGTAFELEMSVDETATPTSPAEHAYVASELKRLGVKWVSLAPRFVGEFEKGVDYIGDLARFEDAFAKHVQIARHLGPYKISLHSGSDKFSIYPVAARAAGELVHVKTAGTSYLEALRAIAGIDPGLFREIVDFAFQRYEEDKASYHVSGDPRKVARPKALRDDELAGVLDSFDGRQLLHVTYGSVLTVKDTDGHYRFRDRLLLALRRDEEAHYAAVSAHIRKHVMPFASG